MQFLLDNLTATFVAMVVFLIVVSVQHSNREGLTESTAFYMMVRQQEAFAATVTRDMQGINQLLVTTETDNEFSFLGHIGDDPTVYTITYRRTLAHQQDDIQYYQIERLVNGLSGGGSPSMLTSWEIEGWDESGRPVADPAAAAQVFIHFELASIIGDNAEIERTRWEASFFPPLLQ